MNWLEREKEEEELQKLIMQDKEEELDPDYCQYAVMKWKVRE